MSLDNWLLLGISLERWAIALAVGLLSYLILAQVTRFLTKRVTAIAQRTSSRIDDVIAEVLANTNRFIIFLVAVLMGCNMLDLPAKWELRLSQAWVIVIGIQVALWLNRAINVWMREFVDRSAAPELRNRATTTTMVFLIRLLVLLTVALTVLANLGVNITAFVASLGIGGIAIALALQTILSDLFASLSIGLDKPFEVGDFIIVDDMQGTVEYIGVKTTRLRSLSGEQLVRSNTELLKSPIRNYKRMSERRALFSFRIAYQTPVGKVAELSEVVRAIITAVPQTRFDRAHFQKFGDNGLDFEVVYYVLAPDYNIYMDVQQQINLELMRACEERGIDLVPSTTMRFSSELKLAERAAQKAPAEASEPA
jgi:small-conductance mechanosensitive channel